jgi:hypothetical protein
VFLEKTRVVLKELPPNSMRVDKIIEKINRTRKEKLKKQIKKKPGIIFLGPRSQFLIFKFF